MRGVPVRRKSTSTRVLVLGAAVLVTVPACTSGPESPSPVPAAISPAPTDSPSTAPAQAPATTAGPATASPSPVLAASDGDRSWLSGASGTGVADGDFAAWRGAPVPISGSWADVGPAEQVALAQFDPGAEYDRWSGSMDLGVGAIFPDQGESWAQAAAGAYDARWTQMLTRLRDVWENRPRGTLYLRFAQEWNGDFSAWGVGPQDLPDFVATWRRFAGLQRQLFPAARLVFCTNGLTSGYDYDWRDGWPGDDVVDVYATDWYADEYSSDADLTAIDDSGAPSGLEAHREFAEQHGKPFALSEWGNHFSAAGDRPDFIDAVRRFAAEHGGTGPGELLYEVYFNVIWSPNDYALFPVDQSLAPSAAAAYRTDF